MTRQMVIGSRASACGVQGLTRRTTLRSAPTRKVTKAGDTQVIVSAINGAMLAIGRFGFLPYQRRQIEKAGLPLQNDVTNLQAGMSEGLATDKLATEAKVFETKDPAGFTLIDTIAWGSLGHVLAFVVLATKNANDLGIVVSPHW